MSFVRLPSADALRTFLASIRPGTKLRVSLLRDQVLQDVVGELAFDGHDFHLRQGDDVSIILPSPDLQVLEASVLDASDAQRRPPQPPADFTAILSIMNDQNNAMMHRMTQLIDSRLSSHTDRLPPPPTQSGQQGFNDVSSILRMSDALRGQDNPTWRIAAGLILPRFVPEKLYIASIPHLLFQEDPLTGEMVKRPKGTAATVYRAMLPSMKLQFPNQIQMAVARSSNNRNATDFNPDSANAGVRTQLELAERMFYDLLQRLDQLDAEKMPGTKTEWLIFIDASAQVLGHYATLARGFPKGGGKLIQAYNQAINTKGPYDPNKLWAGDTDSFRM